VEGKLLEDEEEVVVNSTSPAILLLPSQPALVLLTNRNDANLTVLGKTLFSMDAPDIRPDNPAFFYSRYPAGY
jgi:hypothetical protein